MCAKCGNIVMANNLSHHRGVWLIMLWQEGVGGFRPPYALYIDNNITLKWLGLAFVNKVYSMHVVF